MRGSSPISSGRRAGSAAPTPGAAPGAADDAVSRFRDPLIDAYFAAAADAGHPKTDDYNGAQQEGFAVLQATIRNGRRCSTAVAYLRPALGRPNLTVRTGVLATRVVFEGTRAVGVEYLDGGVATTVRAEREVLLCGGVINSPQLLMLSGIGEPAQLEAHGIDVRAALPGVGKNLQDHISASVAYSRKEPGSLHRRMRLDRLLPDLARAYFTGGRHRQRPAGRDHGVPQDAARRAATFDLQLLFNAAPMTAHPTLRRSVNLMPTASPAAPLCCGRRAAGSCGSPRPTRACRPSSGRISSRSRRTGPCCARACAWSS